MTRWFSYDLHIAHSYINAKRSYIQYVGVAAHPLTHSVSHIRTLYIYCMILNYPMYMSNRGNKVTEKGCQTQSLDIPGCCVLHCIGLALCGRPAHQQVTANGVHGRTKHVQHNPLHQGGSVSTLPKTVLPSPPLPASPAPGGHPTVVVLQNPLQADHVGEGHTLQLLPGRG